MTESDRTLGHEYYLNKQLSFFERLAQTSSAQQDFKQAIALTQQVTGGEPYDTYRYIGINFVRAGFNTQPVLDILSTMNNQEAAVRAKVDILTAAKQDEQALETLSAMNNTSSNLNLTLDEKDALFIEIARSNAYETIAKDALKRKDVDIAMEAARRNGNAVFIADIAANCALLVAQQGEDASDLVIIANTYLNQTSDSNCMVAKKAEIFSIIVKAKYFNEKDLQPELSKILAILDDMDDYTWQVPATVAVAENLSACNIDVADILQKATLTTMQFINRQANLDWLDIAEWGYYTEDLALTQSRYGNYEAALSLVDKIKDVDSADNRQLFTEAKILSDRAAAKAKRGLSLQEIQQLSAADIQVLNLPSDILDNLKSLMIDYKNDQATSIPNSH